MYGVAIGAIALLFGRMALDGCIHLYETNAGGQVALAVTGWLISTLGPIALYALLVASAFMLLTVLVHTAALIVEGCQKIMRRATSSQ